jgi:hypothetical protein
MFYLGDYGPRSSFPELATFYPWQLPFYLIGLYGLFKNQKYKELRFLTILLLLVSPIPASLTIDPYSTIRSLPLVIPQIIIISLGITTIIPYRGFHKPLAFKVKDERSIKDISSLARNLKTKIIASTGFIIVLFFSIIHFYSSAFILNEYYRAKDWDYGWQQLVEVLNRLDPKLPIVIDNARGEGYSQIAFYLKADPIKYQTENFEVSEDEYYSKMKRQTTKKIDQITLRGIDWIPDTSIKQYLIGDYLAISPEQIKANNLHLIAEIKYPDNSPAFVVVKTNPK